MADTTPDPASRGKLKRSIAAKREAPERITFEGYTFSEGELEWARQHLGQMRRTVRGNRMLYWMLAITFALGLILYLLSFAMTGKVINLPPGWFAKILPDFLYNLGIILWTSVILVLFLEVAVDIQRKRWRRYIKLIEKVSAEQDMEIPAESPMPEEEVDVESRMEAVLARLEALEKSWEKASPEHAAEHATHNTKSIGREQ